MGDFDRIIFSDQPVKFDSLTTEKLQIVVRRNDTVPRFAIDSDRNIKSYKSFPVFIKNISGKKIILYENKSLGTFVLNKNNKWQSIWNDDGFNCGDEGYNKKYWVLNPEEIMIFSVNYLKGQEKAKLKIGMSSYFLSEEFNGNIDPNLLKNNE